MCSPWFGKTFVLRWKRKVLSVVAIHFDYFCLRIFCAFCICLVLGLLQVVQQKTFWKRIAVRLLFSPPLFALLGVHLFNCQTKTSEQHRIAGYKGCSKQWLTLKQDHCQFYRESSLWLFQETGRLWKIMFRLGKFYDRTPFDSYFVRCLFQRPISSSSHHELTLCFISLSPLHDSAISR